MTNILRHIPNILLQLLHRYGTAFVVLVLWSCATSIPPDGGPPDTEAPIIEETQPVHASTNVSSREIRFVFNEYIDRNSFQQAVHISPLMDTPPRFEWSGKEVTILLQDELIPDQTYVISVGTGVKDVNAGNQLASSFTLAFSTGDSLDKGIIRGKVYDAEPAGISAFAYRLEGLDPDTLNPATLRPDYAIQTDESGEFVLSNLAAGSYRVFAVRDKQNDYMYSLGSDAIGIAENDIVAGTDSGMAPLRYLIHVEDTTAPYIQSVRPVTERSAEVRISEPPVLPAQPLRLIQLVDSASADAVPLVDLLPVPGKNTTYTLFTGYPFDEVKYIISIDSLRDAAGNEGTEERSRAIFTGNTEPDTLRPEIVAVYPAPRGKDVLVDSVFSVTFTRPMAITAGLRLSDSSDTEVSLEAFWKTPHELLLTHDPLSFGMQYTLCIGLSTFTDSLNSRTVADSTFCFAFTTIESEVDGSISGNVKLAKPANSPVRVTARATGGTWAKTTTAREGTYVFPKVPEGKYILEGYVDADTSGTYSFGTPIPFTPAERFGILRDTIRVRARWESEGADITIP